MSTASLNKPKKSGKSSKSSSKSKPNLEISCKFRGKYDLNKKNNNKDISLENAINLFEVIYKKNESLFKDTTIKMFKEKKMFSFGDKKGISKVHHRVPYIQVNKFFVLHRDPTMIIMGVHHKSHKWFLVFQFNNVEDLTKFCDEIEGEKKVQTNQTEEIELLNDSDNGQLDVPEIQIDHIDGKEAQEVYEDPRDFEKISIHSAMINNKEMSAVDFNEDFYEPDLNNPISNELERVSVCSSRRSSRSSSSSDADDRVHCDDLRQSKLKDLFIKAGNDIYSNAEFCDEDLTCINYSKNNTLSQTDKTGPIYMYCAQFKNREWNGKINDDIFSLTSANEIRFFEPTTIKETKDFNHFEPKLITSDINDFNHFDAKILDNDSKDFHHHEPKFNASEDLPTFEHFEPKFIAI